MVEKVIEDMNIKVKSLYSSIEQDIEDIKEARHEELEKRNLSKEILIRDIATLKERLDEELIQKIQDGEDINIYRDKVDTLEEDLKKLYELNTHLSNLVLPIKKMYDTLVSEISELNGGNIFDVKA